MIERMDQRRDALFFMLLLILVVSLTLLEKAVVEGNVVFNVQHKYGGQRTATLGALKAHDMNRRGRFLAAIDMPVGGNAKFTEAGLYYAKVAIGTPPKDFHLQIDTGSNLMWVNCASCESCPDKSKLGFDHALYDQKASSTSKTVTCDQDFCTAAHNGPYKNCTTGKQCDYSTTYVDGSVSSGHFVKDNIRFDETSGDFKTKPMDASIAFGCSSKKSGQGGTSTDSVDGIIGFGQANSSLLSQLAVSNKARKVFSHCFDGKNGGGVLAIGEVVEPAVKHMLPLLRDEPHYTVIMKDIDVGGKVIELYKGFFGIGGGVNTVIDSGATLAFLPEDIFKQLMDNIMAAHQSLKSYTYEKDFTCFPFEGDINKEFPIVTFLFKDSVSLKVYPHEYLIQLDNGDWCLGWQKNEMQQDGEDMILLGDLALSNKVVVYDLEKQALGWAEHNCSSTIKIKDEGSGPAYALQGDNISPPSSANKPYALNALPISFLIAAAFYHMIV